MLDSELKLKFYIRSEIAFKSEEFIFSLWPIYCKSVATPQV